MIIAAPFTIAKRWEQPKCPPMDGWTNNMWCSHTMDYNSAFKKKGALTHTFNMDGRQKHAKRKKPDTRARVLLLHLYEAHRDRRQVIDC